MGKDFYALLGVSKTASKEEIKEAFRSLALRYHPDRNNDAGASARFAEVSEAYSVLSDDEKRALYDELGPEGYADPLEAFRIRLEREIAAREAWKRRDEYEPVVPSFRDDTIQTIVMIVVLLLMWYFFLKGL